MMIVAPLACGLAPAGGATLPSLVQTRVKLSGVPPPPASSRIQKATVLSPRQPPAAPLLSGPTHHNTPSSAVVTAYGEMAMGHRLSSSEHFPFDCTQQHPRRHTNYLLSLCVARAPSHKRIS